MIDSRLGAFRTIAGLSSGLRCTVDVDGGPLDGLGGLGGGGFEGLGGGFFSVLVS